MKKLSLLTILVVLLCHDVKAQRNVYSNGGFGHFIIGASPYNNPKLSEYLADGILYTDIPVLIPGMVVGGEGAWVLNNLVLGGGGMALTNIHINDNQTKSSLSVGLGFLKFGYIFHHVPTYLVYLYGDVGFGGTNIKFTNLSGKSSLYFNKLNPINPGDAANYSIPTLLYEAGLSYKSLFFTTNENISRKGGLMLGFDLGISFLSTWSNWKTDGSNTAVSGPPVKSLGTSPYLRITLGGGGFNIK